MAQATITWTNSTSVGVTETIIYRDDIEIGRVPVADASVFFDTNTTPGATYKYEVQAVSAEGESIDEVQGVNVMDLTIPGASTGGLRPVLSNFTIENGQPNRVYFNSSKLIQVGINGDIGFIIEGKTITGVSINAGSTSGHYFTLSTSLNFWDNILIRYEGGSDIVDSESNALYNFTLQYIQNNINEPLASNDYYVSTNGLDTNNGTSISTPWKTINKAAQTVTSGSTVWIKAGDYGSENVVIANDGLVGSPIKFIGYKITPGDVVQLTRSIGMLFNSVDMPTLTNGTGNAIITNNKNYIIFKNIQVDSKYGYTWGIYINNSTNVFIDNCYLSELLGVSIYAKDLNSGYNRVTNSYVADCRSAGVILQNKHNLIKNTWAVSSKVTSMDYYLTMKAGNDGHSNCCIDSYAHRYVTDSHTGHGFSFRGDLPTTLLRYSLVENCEVVNMQNGGIEFRRSSSSFNVARNCIVRNDGVNQLVRAITFTHGTFNNIVEDCFIENVNYAFYFYSWSAEDSTYYYGGKDNTIINTTVKNANNVVVVTINSDDSGLEQQNIGNKFLNLTIDNCDRNIYDGINTFNNTNEFKNTIFTNTALTDLGPIYTYSDFFNGFTMPTGTGNIAVDPKLDINLKPTVDTPVSVYEGGTSIGVEYDKDGVERKAHYSIGAYEKNI